MKKSNLFLLIIFLMIVSNNVNSSENKKINIAIMCLSNKAFVNKTSYCFNIYKSKKYNYYEIPPNIRKNFRFILYRKIKNEPCDLDMSIISYNDKVTMLNTSNKYSKNFEEYIGFYIHNKNFKYSKKNINILSSMFVKDNTETTWYEKIILGEIKIPTYPFKKNIKRKVLKSLINMQDLNPNHAIELVVITSDEFKISNINLISSDFKYSFKKYINKLRTNSISITPEFTEYNYYYKKKSNDWETSNVEVAHYFRFVNNNSSPINLIGLNIFVDSDEQFLNKDPLIEYKINYYINKLEPKIYKMDKKKLEPKIYEMDKKKFNFLNPHKNNSTKSETFSSNILFDLTEVNSIDINGIKSIKYKCKL